MPTDIPPLTYGTFYHIYNRGNNHENIFLQERNYAYFLDLWWKHVHPIAETWAYCLLRNHFHAVVFIKNKEDLTGRHGTFLNWHRCSPCRYDRIVVNLRPVRSLSES